LQAQSEHLVTPSERLDKLRRAKGLSWQELAEELGVSRVMLHYVRSGQKPLGVKLEFRIRQAEESAGIGFSGDRMNKSISRRPSPCDKWMEGLRLRWGKRKASQDELKLAIRVLFPEEVNEIIAWLGGNAGRSHNKSRR
jgi:transcriptional regulator with XRE-family HTH domain